jgi:hypothetical protein
MGQFRFTLTPTGGHLNSFSRGVRERDDVQRVAIRWLNGQRDGTATALYQMAGEARGVDRLFIADHSVLGNSLGGPNPTNTGQALAMRTAEKLSERYFTDA